MSEHETTDALRKLVEELRAELAAAQADLKAQQFANLKLRNEVISVRQSWDAAKGANHDRSKA